MNVIDIKECIKWECFG